MAADEDVDIEAKIDDYLAEIESVDKEIMEASAESRALLGQIYELNARLQEARFLGNRYKALRTQYMSDIKRLGFVVDGDAKGKAVKHKDSCPFCGHDMETEEEDHTAYVESAKSELARIRLQLGDLEITELDTKNEIKELESRLKDLNAKNNNITELLNQRLRPHASELKAAVAEYRRIQQPGKDYSLFLICHRSLGRMFLQKKTKKMRQQRSLTPRNSLIRISGKN